VSEFSRELEPRGRVAAGDCRLSGERAGPVRWPTWFTDSRVRASRHSGSWRCSWPRLRSACAGWAGPTPSRYLAAGQVLWSSRFENLLVIGSGP